MDRPGVDVSYCIATDGDAGGSDHSVTRAEMAAIRREEQWRRPGRSGVTDVTFLGFPDGRVTASLELRAAISRVIRMVRPDRVVGQSPERNWSRDLRQPSGPPGDRRSRGVRRLSRRPEPVRLPQAAGGGSAEHTVPELWVMATERANRVVDATDAYPRKLAALQVPRQPGRRR